LGARGGLPSRGDHAGLPFSWRANGPKGSGHGVRALCPKKRVHGPSCDPDGQKGPFRAEDGGARGGRGFSFGKASKWEQGFAGHQKPPWARFDGFAFADDALRSSSPAIQSQNERKCNRGNAEKRVTQHLRIPGKPNVESEVKGNGYLPF